MGSFLKQLNYSSFWASIYEASWPPQCCGESGYEQQWRDRAGYRLNVYLKVTSEKEDKIVVEYSSHRHEEQEQNDALSKQVTRSAEETEMGESNLLMCIISHKNPQTLDCCWDQMKDFRGLREWGKIYFLSCIARQLKGLKCNFQDPFGSGFGLLFSAKAAAYKSVCSETPECVLIHYRLWDNSVSHVCNFLY